MRGVSTLTLPIATERLLLRPFEDGDLAALHAMQSVPSMTRYLYWEPRSVAEVRTALDAMKRMTGIDETNDSLRLGAVLRETGELVGDYGLWLSSRQHRQGELGFVTHPEHQGRGYALEGTLALLRVGFEVYGLHRIAASCDARNAASEGVMKRLGMRREAHFLENEFVKGEWTGGLIYAMLASEWEARSDD